MSNQTKKKHEFMETCALLFILTCVCALLTWIIPAGEFEKMAGEISSLESMREEEDQDDDDEDEDDMM